MQRKSSFILALFTCFIFAFALFVHAKPKAKDTKNKKKETKPVVTPATPTAQTKKKVEEDIPTAPDGGESPHASMMFYVTPEITEITMTPALPKAKDNVIVSARIANNSELTDISMTQSAALNFSLDDGKVWQEVKMEKDGSGQMWSAAIPKQKRGTHVLYFIHAADNTGNFAVEVPARTALDENTLTQVCSDPDDPSDWVPDDLDVLGIWTGASADKIMVKVKVQGSISTKGKKDGMVHAYASPLINPDTPSSFDLFTAKALLYAPVMQFMGAEPFGLYDLMSMMSGKISEALVKDAHVQILRDSEKSPDTLTFELNRTALGSNPSAAYKVSAMTLGFADIKEISTVPWDATSYAMIYMRNHEYEIK